VVKTLPLLVALTVPIPYADTAWLPPEKECRAICRTLAVEYEALDDAAAACPSEWLSESYRRRADEVGRYLDWWMLTLHTFKGPAEPEWPNSAEVLRYRKAWRPEPGTQCGCYFYQRVAGFYYGDVTAAEAAAECRKQLGEGRWWRKGWPYP
jgi:hypothetical protein